MDLSKEQFSQLQGAFDSYDTENTGRVRTHTIRAILGMLGHEVSNEQLVQLINEFDSEDTGEIKFEDFCTIASRFMGEQDTDIQAMQEELREAFRLYDKEGNGYITTDVFRDILHELDEELSPWELDMIIEEVDADGSGTLDFDEFMQVMTG